MPEGDSRRIGPLALFLVLLLAAAVRIPTIRVSLPYLGYVDEGHVLHPVITLLRTGGWDPGTYLHPSLTVYLITGTLHLARPAYRMIHGHSLLADLPADETYYDLVSPPEVILLARVLIATVSVATVALVCLLAARLGGRRAAILAGLMAGLCPALVTRAPIVIIDTVSTFFALAALWFAHRLGEPAAGESSSPLRDAILAGACAGLAFTAKYTIATVFLAVAFMILTRSDGLRERLRLVLVASVAAVGAAIMSMPALVLRPRAVRAAILEQARLYSDPALFAPTYHGPNYFGQALHPLELWLPLSAASVFGLGWMLTRRPTRRAALAWSLFAVALVAPLIAHRYQPFRNVLPLVPPLCIAAALPLAYIPARAWTKWLRTIAAAVILASLGGVLGLWLSAMIRLVDSRTSLVEWLILHARPHNEVLVLSELAILPAELRRIPAKVRLVPWLDALQTLETLRFDYFVVGDIDLTGPAKPEWAPYLERYREAASRLRQEISFGRTPAPVFPNLWRGNDELLIVLRPPRAGEGKP